MSSGKKAVRATPAAEVTAATKNFYEKYGEAATQHNIVGRLLKFNKFGEYRAGQEEEEIARGRVLVAYMPSLSAVYVRWEDNRPADVRMGPVGEGFIPPPRAELGYMDPSQWDTFDDGRPRDPWQFSNSLILVDLETEELFTFSTSSRGGLGAIGELAKLHGKHIRMKPDEVPVVELDVGSYQHSKREYGEIRFPIFKEAGWILLSKLPAINGATPDDNDGDGQPVLELPEPAPPAKPAAPVKPARSKAAPSRTRAPF